MDMATSLIDTHEDCVNNGVDTRVPENKRAATAAAWCNVVQVLKGVTAQPLKQQYFVLLQDHVKVDQHYFEETIKSFTDSYWHHDWDLVQIDPLGKQNDADKVAPFKQA